ncbi:MAG: class I tRNA ligase family protein [Candidatus Thermoplasmatota archaeon]|nr:class I tRNA ligase family protein [Candidatus Thermoplasmatota archaeon]
MQIYNTLTRKLEGITGRGLNPLHINMYVCGPTVYDAPHVGHGRSYIFFDVLKRALILDGYSVSHLQNFSDVDEKIDNRAKEEGVEPIRLADRYSEEFIAEMDMLGVIRPDMYVRASESRDVMHRIALSFIRKDLAYEAGGNVYFRTSSGGGYGSLLHDTLDNLITGHEADNFRFVKENKEDFTIWLGKFDRSNMMSGRPSWNLECFSMVHKYFGCELDIQGGGMDLIFPHHEVASVMSKAYCRVEFADFYVHNGFVTLKKDKMSKSTNNFISVHSLLDDFSPESIRLYLLSVNFRQNIEFSITELREYEESISVLRKTARDSGALKNERVVGISEAEQSGEYWSEFQSALNRNLDTSGATRIMMEEMKGTGFKGKEGKSDFRLMCAALGLFNHRPSAPQSEK